MKYLLKILLILALPVLVNAQTRQQMDSLYTLIQESSNDTILMVAYSTLGSSYDDVSLLSALDFCEKGVQKAQKLDFKLNEAEALGFMSFPLMKMGYYLRALIAINQSLEIAEDPSSEKSGFMSGKDQTPRAYRLNIVNLAHLALLNLHGYTGNYKKQISVALETKALYESARDTLGLAFVHQDIGNAYFNLNQIDSALFHEAKSLFYYARLAPEDRKFEGSAYTSIGDIYEKMDSTLLAMNYYRRAMHISELRDNPSHLGDASLRLAELYLKVGELDSSSFYAYRALTAFGMVGREEPMIKAHEIISNFYIRKGDFISAYFALRIASNLRDSTDRKEKIRLQEFQVAVFNQQLEAQQREQERIEQDGKLKTMAIIGLVVVFGTIGFLLYRNNRQKRKANDVLQQKNTEIELALHELRATQAQLIQSEKMASLGELTAGIAHEIQNPLNFVNNFSEVSNELLDEIKTDLATGNWQSANELIENLKQNLEKILHHGKRADGIVKGMLQHSRASSNQKELTDINDLCDEYLRLAFHGYRAKDKSFNAKFETNFDESIPKLNVVPQDIGRVILNLINNAFYAVNVKKQNVTSHDYSPLVMVSTKSLGNKIVIRVKDNGNGIPESAKEKIFQPFFTTKPSGQGTGLGLSLSYDIAKAHGGQIKVNTKENVETEFLLELPV